MSLTTAEQYPPVVLGHEKSRYVRIVREEDGVHVYVPEHLLPDAGKKGVEEETGVMAAHGWKATFDAAKGKLYFSKLSDRKEKCWTLPAYAAASSAASASTSASEKKTKKKAKTTGATKSSTKKTAKSLSKTKASGASSLDMGDFSLPYRRAAQTAGDGDDEDDEDDEDNNNNKNSNSSGDDDEAGAIYEKASSTIAANPFHPMSGDPSSEQYETHPLAGALNFGEYDDDDRDVIENNIHGRVLDAHPMPFFSRGGQQPPSPPPQEFYHDRTPPTGLTSPTSHNDALVEQDVAPRASVLLRHREESDTINTFDDGLPPESSPMPNASSSSMMMVTKDTASHQRPMEPHSVTVAPVVIEALTMDEEFAREDIEMGEGSDRDVIVYEALAERDEISFRQPPPPPAVSQAANSAVAVSLPPPQPPKYGYDEQQTIHQDDVQRPRNNTHYSSSPDAVVTGPASSWSASKPEGRGADMEIVQSLADLILSESHEFERREATVSRELAILLQKRALELQEQQQQEVSSRLPSAHADEQQTQQEPPQPLPSFVVPTLTTDGSVIRTAAEDYSGEQRTPLEDLLAQIANEEDDGEFQQQQSLRSRPANSTVAASTVASSSDALPPLTTNALLSSPPSSPRGASEDEASLFPPSCRALAAHLRMDSLQLAAHPEFRHEYVHDAVEHPEHHAGGMIPHFDTHNADISRKVHSGDGHPIVCSPTTISTESAVFQPTATATSTSSNNAKDVENIWSGRVSSQASRFTDSGRSSAAAADAPPPSARRRTAVLIEEPLSAPEKHIINNIVQPEQQQQQSATTPATASQSLSIQKPTDSPSLGPEFESGSDGSPTFANTNYASFRRPLRNVKDSFYIAKHPNDRHEYIQQHTSHTTTAGGSSALQYHHDDSGDDSVTSPLGSSNPFRNLKDSVVFSRDVEGHTKYVQDQSNTMSMLSAKEWRAVEAQRQQLLEQATGATRLAPLEEQLNTSKVLERLQRLKDSTSAAAAHVTFISSSGGAAAADDRVIAGHHLPTTATAASSSSLISSVSLHPTFVDQTAATQQQPILLRKDEELRRLHEAARAYLTSAAVGEQNSKGNNGVRLPQQQQSAPPPASLTNADALLEHRLEAVMSRLLIQDSLYLYQEALDAKLLESANWSLEAMRIFQRFLETMPPKTKTIAVQASEVTSDSATSTKPEPPLSTPTAPVGIATSSTSTTSMQVNYEQRLPRQDEEVVVHQPHASRWWPEKEEESRRGASGSPPPRNLLQSEEIHGVAYANYDEDHEYQARIDRIRALQQYEPQQQRSEAVRSGVPRELYERGSRRTLTPALPDALKRPGAGSAMDRSSPSYPLRMQTAFPMTPDASDLAARRGNTGTRVEPAAYTPSSVAAWEATPPPPLGSGTPLTRPLNHEQAAFLRWDVKRSGNVLISQTGTVTMADSSRALKAIQADEAQRAQQQKVTIPMFALGTIGISQGDFVFEIRCELLPSHEALPTTSKFGNSSSSSRSPLVANGALKPGQRAPVHRCFVGVASKYYRGPTRTTPAYLYGSDGTILASASDTVGVPYGARWHTQAVVTVHLSFSRRELSFAVDGVPQGVAFKFQRQDDPEPLFPLVVFHGDGDSCAFQPPSLSLSPPRNVNRGLDWRVLSTPN